MNCKTFTEKGQIRNLKLFYNAKRSHPVCRPVRAFIVQTHYHSVFQQINDANI